MRLWVQSGLQVLTQPYWTIECIGHFTTGTQKMDCRVAEGVIEDCNKKAHQGFMHDDAAADAVCGADWLQAF
jgi:hypothetical protein